MILVDQISNQDCYQTNTIFTDGTQNLMKLKEYINKILRKKSWGSAGI